MRVNWIPKIHQSVLPSASFFTSTKRFCLSTSRPRGVSAVYDIEMVQNEGESDDSMELLFASFSIDDDYAPSTKKESHKWQNRGRESAATVMQSVIPILKGFMVAITD